MTRSIFLNLLVIAVVVAFAAVVAVPAQETIGGYGDPRDPSVLAHLIEEAHDVFTLLDVRTPAEFAQGYIPGAINIDYRNLDSAMAEADRTRPIVLYCRTGNRSAQAERTLRAMGFTQVFDFGGLDRWPGKLNR